MTLPYDYARCHGDTEQCQDCQRRTETNHHPLWQGWMRVELADGEVCEYKIKGETQ